MKTLRLIALWLVCSFGTVATLLVMFGKIFINPEKAIAIMVALDRAGNAAVNGDNRETISSRAYRAMTEGRAWGCVLCKMLDVVKKDHCKDSEGK